jgi:signal transduction histidine kinase
VALLLFAVAVPAACLLWFMAAAMRNERFAVRQQLAEAYRAQLSASQMRLQEHWRRAAAELERLVATASAPAAFARSVRSGIVDSVVIFGEEGRVLYPNTPATVKSSFGDMESRWQEAADLEQVRQFTEAATCYDAVARAMTNANSAARAFQAEARCLAQARQHSAAIELVNEVFSTERYSQAADLQGRLIAANAELMALELSTDRHSEIFHSIASRLALRLLDYDNPALAAPQRRFLMKELQRLSPEKIEFPTLAAEEMAAEVMERHSSWPREPVLQPAAGSDLWQFTTPNRRVLALMRSYKIVAAAKAVISENPLPNGEVTLVSPDAENSKAFVTFSAGEQMPGWRFAISLKNQATFYFAAKKQTTLYLWTGVLVVSVMGVLTLLTLRIVRRQMALARLKNDLAATVSHEFKTPLSSMRVLIDTLLDADKLDEQRTREYLQLISQENDRLGRLIQNFLTFSRMERKRHTFHFSPLPAERVIGAAVEAVRLRSEAAGCRIDVRVDGNLPSIMADADALAAALTNLLENACKYSDETNKQIVVGVRAENGNVIFSVQDHGIGIAAHDQKNIFQPFYQVEQHLSRETGGCGLGLSIVRFVTTAHRGTVGVVSRPGQGSTFTISLPINQRISIAS